MTTLDIDKIDAVRHMAAEEMGLESLEDAGNLTSGFHGNFYMKFADNQYKVFEQDLVALPKEAEIHLDPSSEPDMEQEEAERALARLEGDFSMLLVPVQEVDDEELFEA
jgi:hypothetical protein